MFNRFTRGALAAGAALLTFGVMGTTMASAAAGGTIVTNGDPGYAGYQAGGHDYFFRYVTTTFVIPELACTGQDDFVGAGAALWGTNSFAGVFAYCNGATPTIAWSTDNLRHPSGGNLVVSADDSVTVTVFYDATTGYDNFYATDNTTGRSGSWAHKAGPAEFSHAYAEALMNNPLEHPPAGGSNYTLVPFLNTGVTSISGVHGTGGGMNGPWGISMVIAMTGAHLTAEAPVIYNNDTTFNVRVFGPQ
jgi:hypothetical protein